ncbi:MAG TPA: hypothetical protein VD860_02265 [Azospirillum sp.]|nr:hypothetical protein [Azospirillum sp.]
MTKFDHGRPATQTDNRVNEKQTTEDRAGPKPGEPTNPDRSRKRTGGGERDVRHSHDPDRKA